MSHHHSHHHNEPSGLTKVEPTTKGVLPLFNKNDLAFLAMIKQLLSPSGQKLVDLVLLFSGATPPSPENPPDIMGLLSQLNLTGDNNNIKELLMNLLNSVNNSENKANPNMAMLTSLINSISPKNKPEDS